MPFFVYYSTVILFKEIYFHSSALAG